MSSGGKTNNIIEMTGRRYVAPMSDTISGHFCKFKITSTPRRLLTL